MAVSSFGSSATCRAGGGGQGRAGAHTPRAGAQVTLRLTANGQAQRRSDAARSSAPAGSLPRPLEGKGTPLWEQTAPADDDLVGVVGVSLVADVVEPAQVRTVARDHPVARGGGEQTTELRQPAQALLDTLLAARLGHASEA